MPESIETTLLDELEALHREHGRIPTQALMEGHGSFSPERYVEKFGSWEDALEAAGFDPAELDDERYLALGYLEEERIEYVGDLLNSNDSKEFFSGQLLAELQRLAVELDKTPSGPDMENFGRHSYHSYVKYFGSWNEAIEILGLVPNNEKFQISDEELLGELQRLAEEKGSTPSTVDMQSDGKYSYPTYIYRFGSWDEACEEAGI